MTKTLAMASHKNHNLGANEGFVIFLTSKLFTCFIGGFTLKMKSQSIAYLLNESEHIYWILDLEGEVHSIWDLWISGLQECKDNDFFEVVGRQQFSVGSRKSEISGRAAAPARIYLPYKFVGGTLTSRKVNAEPGTLRITLIMQSTISWLLATHAATVSEKFLKLLRLIAYLFKRA